MKSVPVSVRVLLALLAAGGLLAWGTWTGRREPLPDSTRSGQRLSTTAPESLLNCAQERPQFVPPSRGQSLTDVTDAVGIDFQHTVGPLGTYFLPESIGVGGALFDCDGDGRLDVFFVNAGRSPAAVGEFPPGTRLENRLFRHAPAGRFVEATADCGLLNRGYGVGCAHGDVDNDGDLDVYLTNYGCDALFQNDGRGGFRDISEAAGLHDADWGTCAAFFDYDRDGWLDLVVVNYTSDPVHNHSVACGLMRDVVSYCSPKKFAPTVDRLLHNDGLQPNAEGQLTVHFTDVTERVGLAAAPTYGFGVVCADFSDDGWCDVFIANDAAPNRLWINQRDGTFRDEAALRGVAVNEQGAAEAGMGIALGDVNHDGRFDLVISHLTGETTTLYLSQEGGLFDDATEEAGLSRPTYLHTGWGTALVDLDHDGELDLPLVHGLVIPCHSKFPPHGEDQFQVRQDVITNPTAYWRDYADANLLFFGDGRHGFRDGTIQSGDFGGVVASGRSLMYGDLDDDGDLDLVVTNCGERARVYRNDFPKSGAWLQVRAVDPQHRRDAYGAVVSVRSGRRTWYGLVNPASGYLGSNDIRLHFGLGEIDQVDELVVRWPDGPVEESAEEFPGGAVNRQIVLRRGSGRRAEALR